MDEVHYQEVIASDLEPLIPQFLDNSMGELERLRQALANGDMETVAMLGHSMKGSGLGFGFMTMGELGMAIEEAGKAGDTAVCQSMVDRMEDYLQNVQVRYE